MKKRSNKKDNSFDNFMLKDITYEEKKDFRKVSKEEAKAYILSTIKPKPKFQRKMTYQSQHLLTNPLERERKPAKSVVK